MLTVRHIRTTTVTENGQARVVPVLDQDGREIELWKVEVPPAVEAEGGAAIELYVDAINAGHTPEEALILAGVAHAAADGAADTSAAANAPVDAESTTETGQ